MKITGISHFKRDSKRDGLRATDFSLCKTICNRNEQHFGVIMTPFSSPNAIKKKYLEIETLFISIDYPSMFHQTVA